MRESGLSLKLPNRARRATARATRIGEPAFTLLEVIVVLAVIGAIAALIVPAVGRTATRERERSQLAELTNLFLVERMDAMRDRRGGSVRLLRAGADLLAEPANGPERVWTPWHTDLLDDEGDFLREVEVAFDPRGLTWTRTLAFRSQETSDRIWRISFDALSGAPSLRADTEQSIP